jgi:hypothetical protein
MTITGCNFGSADACEVRVGRVSCLQARVSIWHTQIKCQVPEGSGSHQKVEVCINRVWSNTSGQTANFSYRGE